MKIIEKKDCMGCYACFNICPQNAITMQEDEKGFKYPIIDKEKCIKCGLCKKVCPVINQTIIKNTPQAYAIINKDNYVRETSSSGGCFSLIAEYIIENGGVVFGATFDENWRVKHTWIENIEKIKMFRGSKYLQSTIGDTYKRAKEFLDKGRKVLFTGTPCQIEGLKSYLRKDYDNLYTQDIICHGVPSPKVHDKYLEYQKNKFNAKKIKRIEHRNKENGWKVVEISLMASNAKRHKMFYSAGVEEFLSLVKHAEFIVTNSFHGMIFSVQFKKQFVVFSREQCSNKIEELLNLFGLKDRLLVTGKELFVKDIDYNKVFSKIKNEREKSLDYLAKNLEIMYRKGSAKNEQ